MAFQVHLNSGIIVGQAVQTIYFVTFRHEKGKTLQQEEWDRIHSGVARAVEDTSNGKAGNFEELGNRDVTICIISRRYSDEEESEIFEVSRGMAVCNPLEPHFNKKEGRKRAFEKALGKLFGERFDTYDKRHVDHREVQANGGCKKIRTEFWSAFFSSVIIPQFKSLPKQKRWWAGELLLHEAKRNVKKLKKEEKEHAQAAG